MPHFSRELADYTIYVIDVSGGDKIPRKGGPGITQADLLVINKTDLAAAVGADLGVMERDAKKMRRGGAVYQKKVKHGVGVEENFGGGDSCLAACDGEGALRGKVRGGKRKVERENCSIGALRMLLGGQL